MKNSAYLALLILIIGTGQVLSEKRPGGLPSDVPQAVGASTEERLAALASEPVTKPDLVLTPHEIYPGEPFLITVSDIHATSTVKKLSFKNKTLGVFEHNGKIGAIAPTELESSVGTSTVYAELIDGTILTKEITILPRPKISAPVGIPEKLGGNTPQSAQKLVTTLEDEAQTLRSVRTSPLKLWSGDFIYPVQDVYITDDYGYSRHTGAYVISHKGTDFRAAEGTSVYAMNRGIVRLVREFRNYGKTVVIDHGQGLMTLYLHLSEFNVREGDIVNKGEIIAKSGSTGYANGAHLHLSIKINTVSIDPIKLLELI